MTSKALLKDIISEGSLSRAIDKQPFSGYNQDAVNWLRRYVNPCDDQQLVLTGIPDKEAGRSYIYNKTFVTHYNSTMFQSFDGYFERAGDLTNETITRTGDPTMVVFIRLPFIGLSGVLIEYGSYTSHATGTTFTHVSRMIYDPNFCLEGTFANTNDPDFYTKGMGIKARLMSAGYTIFNNTSKLHVNGNFVTSVYYPHFTLEVNENNKLNHLKLNGVPFTYDQVTGAGNFRTLKGEQGVYGVLGNYHPEFKYVDMTRLGRAAQPRLYCVEYNAGNLVNTVQPTGAGCFFNSVADAHAILNDDWNWYGQVTAYTGDFTNIDFTIKVATVASILVTPISSLNSSTVIQPPCTPYLTEFASDFTRDNLMVYPASWNDWNKVWSSIKSGWRNFLTTVDGGLNAAQAVVGILKDGKVKAESNRKQTIGHVAKYAVETASGRKGGRKKKRSARRAKRRYK